MSASGHCGRVASSRRKGVTATARRGPPHLGRDEDVAGPTELMRGFLCPGSAQPVFRPRSFRPRGRKWNKRAGVEQGTCQVALPYAGGCWQRGGTMLNLERTGRRIALWMGVCAMIVIGWVIGSLLADLL